MRRRAGDSGQPPDFFKGLQWRCPGPYRGGRVTAVAGDPSSRQVFYFGASGGGIWKTQDGGISWENVSDGFFQRASVGALGIAPSDSKVIWVGMGESCIRSNVSHGDGIYRTTDSGESWTHLGLERTRHIGKVRVHPRDPDTVYVAALGHAHGPNPERGVYRSRDGGQTWELVLHRNERAGAVDVCLSPQDPQILFATIWETIRRPWELVSGGRGSGIFRSNDGGDSWTEISRAPGLPKGTLGRIGIIASPAKSGRVYAIVEAEDGAVFRSDDFGNSWERRSEDSNIRQRPWYYHHIYAHPTDPDAIWVLNKDTWASKDGGITFEVLPLPHGDSHDMWVDAVDPQRMIIGNDAGALVSFTGGASWSSTFNQPTAELYHVVTDSGFPYRMYAAQQDNTTISVPIRSAAPGAPYRTGGGRRGHIRSGTVSACSTRPSPLLDRPRSHSRPPRALLGEARITLGWSFQTAM